MKGNLQTCDHSCVLMVSINMGLLKHKTMFCCSMALWLLLSKSCSYSHFRPLLVLASGSQLYDFFALHHQSRENQILSSQALAVRIKVWVCGSDLHNQQQNKSDFKSLMIPDFILGTANNFVLSHHSFCGFFLCPLSSLEQWQRVQTICILFPCFSQLPPSLSSVVLPPACLW